MKVYILPLPIKVVRYMEYHGLFGILFKDNEAISNFVYLIDRLCKDVVYRALGSSEKEIVPTIDDILKMVKQSNLDIELNDIEGVSLAEFAKIVQYLILDIVLFVAQYKISIDFDCIFKITTEEIHIKTMHIPF